MLLELCLIINIMYLTAIDICEIHDGIYGLEVCANGGSCENDGDGYKCNCLTGYGGRYCELSKSLISWRNDHTSSLLHNNYP